jgi:hypothetical protein
MPMHTQGLKNKHRPAVDLEKLIYINITSFFTFTKKYKFFNEYWTDKKLLYKMGMGGV